MATRLQMLNSPKAAFLLSLIVLLGFLAVTLPSMGAGTFKIRDEYTTLDRANAVHVRGDYLAVYSENIPSFRKPPLHYWMSAAFLDLGLAPNLSARLPSFLFGLGTVVLTGWLALLILPNRPIVQPVAMALMAANAGFLASSGAAMLDTGMTFFGLAAVVGLLLALRDPRWWYLAGLACGLGSLQKAPAALLATAICGLMLWALTRFGGLRLRPGAFGRHFALASILALAVFLSWPVLQWIQFGFDAVKQAYLVEMLQRFSPLPTDSGKTHAAFQKYLLDDDGLFRVPAILAMISLPLVLKRRELWILPALFVLYAVVVGLAKGATFPRYSLYFVPYLAASLAVGLVHTLRSLPLALAISALFCVQNIPQYEPSWKDSAFDDDLVRIVDAFHRDTLPETSLILCDWRPDETRRIPPGMFSVRSGSLRPLYTLPTPEAINGIAQRGATSSQVQGLCSHAQLRELSPYLDNLQLRANYGSHVNFTADITPP